MKFSLFMICVLTATIGRAQSLQLDWVNTLNSDGSNYVYSTLLDNNNAVYITGIFADTVDFDPSPGDATRISNFPLGDAYIAKYTTAGDFLWVKTLNSATSSSLFTAVSMEMNSMGQIVVAGSVQGSVDFDPHAGTFVLNSTGSTFGDFCLAAYSTTGNLMWAKSCGGTSSKSIAQMKIAANDDILLAGSFMGTADFDFGPATFNMTSSGGLDGFYARYNALGNFLWAKRIGGTGSDALRTIAESTSGELAVSGQFSATVDLNPGAGVYNVISNGGIDILLANYTAAGDFIWGHSFGSTNNDSGYDIDFDTGNNILLVGEFRGTVDFDPAPATFNLSSNPATSGSDIFVSRYSPTGSFVNAFSFGGSNTDTPKKLLFSDGQLRVLGHFYYDIDLDPGMGAFSSTAVNVGWFLASYTLNGNLNDALVLGNDQIAQNFGGYDFEVDPADGVYLVGQYKNGSTPLEFNPNGTSAPQNYLGGWDGFLARYSPCVPTSSSQNVSACNSYFWPANGTTYTTSGVYTALLTNVAGCDSTRVLYLTINTVSNNAIINNAPTLNAVLAGSTVSYQWLDCDNGFAPIQGETSQSFTATVNGNYAVQITENGCVDTSSCALVDNLNLADLKHDIFTMYPNPSSGILNVITQFPLHEVLILENLNGEEVLRIALTHMHSTIDLSDFSSGIYFVHLEKAGAVHKLIVFRE